MTWLLDNLPLIVLAAALIGAGFWLLGELWRRPNGPVVAAAIFGVFLLSFYAWFWLAIDNSVRGTGQ